MTFNDVIAKHNFISNVLLVNGKDELDKDLRLKIVKIRIGLFKIRESFEKEANEALKELTPKELITLRDKKDKTDEDNAELKKMQQKLQDDYNSYLISRGNEDAKTDIDTTITEDEFTQIINVNSNNDDIMINNQKISAGAFLEIFYKFFVEK